MADESLEKAGPAALATPVPTDPAARRLNELVGFATEIAIWQAFGMQLRGILCGFPDDPRPGLIARCGNFMEKRQGILTVDRSFIPDPPPWIAAWPEPATPQEAVALKALRLHLEKLRDVHALLAIKPANKVRTHWSDETDLGGYEIPKDYGTRIQTAAARLGVLHEKIARAAAFLPALPEMDIRASMELSWPEAVERLAIAEGEVVAQLPQAVEREEG